MMHEVNANLDGIAQASEWIGWARTLSASVSVLSNRFSPDGSTVMTTDDFDAREWRRARARQ